MRGRRTHLDGALGLVACALVLTSGGAYAAVDNVDIYPDIYKKTLEDNELIIAGNPALKLGLLDIKNAVQTDLSKTIACLDTLDGTTGKKCVDIAEAFTAAEKAQNKWNAPIWYSDACLTRKYQSLFTPGLASKTIAMMLLDQSFLLWNEFGFHPSYGIAIEQCAKKYCSADHSQIAYEITKVNADFKKNLYGYGDEKNKISGPHLALDWSRFVSAYNGRPSDYISDTYNIWMPDMGTAEAPAVQTLHDFDTTAITLGPDESSSWFVGAKLAALFHLNYHYMLGPDGLFNSLKSVDDGDFLTMVKDEMFELSDQESWSSKQGGSDGFFDSISLGRSVSTFGTMAEFQLNFHEQGKNFMLNRNSNFGPFLKKLAADNGFKHWWYRQNSWLTYTPLLTDLGYDYEDATVTDPIREYVKAIYSVKQILHLTEKAFQDNLIAYLIGYVLMLFAISIITCLAVYVAIKAYMLLRCCCQCLGFCKPSEKEKKKKLARRKTKVAPKPAKKKIDPKKKAADAKKKDEKRPISATLEPVRTPSETRSALRLRLMDDLEEVKKEHQREMSDLNEKLAEVQKVLHAHENRPQTTEEVQTIPEERPVTRELVTQTSEIPVPKPPSMAELHMQTSEIPRPVTGDVEAQTSEIPKEPSIAPPDIMRPETAEIELQTSFVESVKSPEPTIVEIERPETAEANMQTSAVDIRAKSIVKSLVSVFSKRDENQPSPALTHASQAEPPASPSETRSQIEARLEADFEEARQLYEDEIAILREKQEQIIEQHCTMEEQQREQIGLEIDRHRVEVQRLTETMDALQAEKDESQATNKKISEELKLIKEDILPAVYTEASKIMKGSRIPTAESHAESTGTSLGTALPQSTLSIEDEYTAELNNKMTAENVLRFLHRSTEQVELLRSDLQKKDSMLKEIQRKLEANSKEKSTISLNVEELKSKLEERDDELERLQRRMKEAGESDVSQALASEAIQAALAVQQVEQLLAEKEQEMSQVRRQSEHFNEAKVSHQKSVSSLQKQLQDKNDEIRDIAAKFEQQLLAMREQKDLELAALERKMQVFTADNSASNMEAEELRQRLAEREAEMKKMEADRDVAMRRLTHRKDSELKDIADKKDREMKAITADLEKMTIEKIEKENELHKLKAKCSTEQLELLNKASDVERMAGEKQRDEATITMLRMNLAKEEVKVKQAVEDLERKQAASKREQALQGTMITGLKDQLRKKNDELKEVHAEVTRRITEYSRQRATQVGSQKMMDLLKSRIEKKDKELKEVHREIARRILSRVQRKRPNRTKLSRN